MIGDVQRPVQVWLVTLPTDTRKSFDGLVECVRAFLGHDPLSGNLFVFRNKLSQRVRISGGTKHLHLLLMPKLAKRTLTEE